MRQLLYLLTVLTLLAPCVAQEASPEADSTMTGYLVETAITPESYLISNSGELQSFVSMLSKVKPFKTLPAPPNPDPFLTGYTPNFEEDILVVAIGQDRISDPPVFRGVETLDDGTRLVRFDLPERTAKTFPYGWAVYTAVILPRAGGTVKVIINGVEQEEQEFKRGDFKKAEFENL
jgi:hypothetical protein